MKVSRSAIGLIVMFAFGSPLSGLAQHAPARVPDGESVVKKVEEPYAGIQDYTVTLDVTADLERLTVPPMHATMYFKQPDKVHFDAESFAMLPREAAALSFAKVHERYLIDNRVELESVDGVKEYRVTLMPKADKTKLKRVLLYVNPERWTADRIVAPLGEGRTMTTLLEYQRMDGRWMPSLLTVKFSYAPGDSTDPNLFEQITPTRRPQAARDGKVVIRYSDYHINTGLSDDVFKPREDR